MKMEMPEIILLILEIIGTISFAISGASVAMKVRFDIFGVVVIACLTAFGGGIIRDILIGEVPPSIFSRLYIIAIAVLTALVAFTIAYVKRKQFKKMRGKIEDINNVFDAIGLAAFSVAGTQIAFSNALSDNAFLSITLGFLTGCGGGVLRDVLTETKPYIFTKHVYAIASIIGAAIYYYLMIFNVNAIFASFVGMVVIFLLRMLATKYQWSLPKIKNEENLGGKTLTFNPKIKENSLDDPVKKYGE